MFVSWNHNIIHELFLPGSALKSALNIQQVLYGIKLVLNTHLLSQKAFISYNEYFSPIFPRFDDLFILSKLHMNQKILHWKYLVYRQSRIRKIDTNYPIQEKEISNRFTMNKLPLQRVELSKKLSFARNSPKRNTLLCFQVQWFGLDVGESQSFSQLVSQEAIYIYRQIAHINAHINSVCRQT